MAQYVQQLTVFLFRTWYTVNKKKWGLNMLKSWTPGEEPDKDEMKVQLEKTRNRLYDLQMKIKEHKLPVLVLFEGWSAAGKGSMIGKVLVFSRLPRCQLRQRKRYADRFCIVI